MEYIGTVIQIKVKEHIFIKFTVEISLTLEQMSIQVEEAQRTPKEQYQKQNPRDNIIVKTLNTQNKKKGGGYLKLQERSHKLCLNSSPIEQQLIPQWKL